MKASWVLDSVLSRCRQGRVLVFVPSRCRQERFKNCSNPSADIELRIQTLLQVRGKRDVGDHSRRRVILRVNPLEFLLPNLRFFTSVVTLYDVDRAFSVSFAP